MPESTNFTEEITQWVESLPNWGKAAVAGGVALAVYIPYKFMATRPRKSPLNENWKPGRLRPKLNVRNFDARSSVGSDDSLRSNFKGRGFESSLCQNFFIPVIFRCGVPIPIPTSTTSSKSIAVLHESGNMAENVRYYL